LKYIIDQFIAYSNLVAKGGKMSFWYHDIKSNITMIAVLLLAIFNGIAFHLLIKQNKIIVDKQSLENLGIVDCYYYSNLPSQTDSEPNKMANGKNVYEGAIAISRDLQDNLQFGDKVKLEIEGQEIKTYVVADLMNNRHRRSVDIFTYKKTGLNCRYRGRLYYAK